MNYVYMDNFRGFSETLIPLCNNIFLLGENSTGKSSFLKLVYSFSLPQFWLSPSRVLQEDSGLGGFQDIVSAWSDHKKYFIVGASSVKINQDDESTKYNCSFMVFTEKDGAPFLSRYVYFNQNDKIKIVFEKKSTKYKCEKINNKFNSEEELLLYYKNAIDADKNDTRGFSKFHKNIPIGAPLGLYVAIVNSIKSKTDISLDYFMSEMPFAPDFTWIAPIRTKPERFYGGLKKSFSPEGDHVPYILRRNLMTRTMSATFAEKMKAFGQASGLFEAIITHSFEKSHQAPFEILVKFSGAELNINNVGYGVSQVLPLLVEFISRKNGRTFAVQQPEVHLHPRAQAALGSLIYELSKERGHKFILETHSEYLIDRFRLCMNGEESNVSAQVLFFERCETGNVAHVLPIKPSGRYPEEQPKAFRDFFIKEEMNILEI